MKHVVGILLILLFAGCGGTTQLEKALTLAGDNRTELERVIEHYKNDDEKLAATCFLIENMIDSYGSSGNVVTACQPFYKQYDSLMLIHSYDSLSHIFDYGKMKLWDKQVDSLWYEYQNKNTFILRNDDRFDLQHITADWLIAEIDMAFEAWQSNAYMCDCPFDDFCEYILPYRHRDGLALDNSRQEFFKRHKGDFFSNNELALTDEVDSLLYLYRHISHSGFAGTKIPVLTAGSMEKLRHGLCGQRCWFNSLLLSSLGLAVATDFVPAWGNRNNSHTWNVLIHGGKSYAFEAFWDTDRWKYKRIYNNLSHDTIWGRYRLPKVYRHSFKRYVEGPVADKDVPIDDIPHFFRNVRKKDVSHEYFDTEDVTVKLENIPERAKYAYLCVLNYNSWQPVQWGRIKQGEATFTAMGKDVLYMPMYCLGGTMRQAADPFWLRQDGSIEILKPEEDKHVVKLHHYAGAVTYVDYKRKTPKMDGTVLLGGINLIDCNDTICVFPKNAEINSVYITANCQYEIRYLKLCLPKTEIALNRLEFYKSGDNGDEKLRQVSIVTNIPNSECGETADAIIDQYTSTGYSANIGKHYVVLDLGETCRLSKVRYCPYQIAGFEKEHSYRLCHWSGGKWTAIGESRSGDGTLTFNNVPKNSILIVIPSNNTERIGSRPFVYRDGEMIWL